MVIVDVKGKQFYMDGITKHDLDRARIMVHSDSDYMFLCDGEEGAGKSVLTLQNAFYLDPSLDLSRVCFKGDEFKRAVINATQYQAVIYDEAFTGLMSRTTMSYMNTILVSLVSQIRQKNLFIFVNMPTFFDLDKYFALWRGRCLFHVYYKFDDDDKLTRGLYAFYNKDFKKSLYLEGKKTLSYFKPKLPSTAYRHFPHFYPVDEAAYRKKKNDALKSYGKNMQEDMIRKEAEQLLFQRVMAMNDITDVAKMKILQMPESTYYYNLKKYRLNADA